MGDVYAIHFWCNHAFDLVELGVLYWMVLRARRIQLLIVPPAGGNCPRPPVLSRAGGGPGIGAEPRDAASGTWHLGKGDPAGG